MNTVIPVLRSFDQAKAEEFYFGFLGFVQDWQHRFEPALPLYQQISLDWQGQRLVLHLSEHHGDACPGACVRLACADLPAFHQRLLDQQYGYARPGLETMPWGMREVRVQDPFGNRLVFFEETESA
ncbi:glyoxalase superfamily protein [Comamonas humi]